MKHQHVKRLAPEDLKLFSYPKTTIQVLAPIVRMPGRKIPVDVLSGSSRVHLGCQGHLTKIAANNPAALDFSRSGCVPNAC